MHYDIPPRHDKTSKQAPQSRLPGFTANFAVDRKIDHKSLDTPGLHRGWEDHWEDRWKDSEGDADEGKDKRSHSYAYTYDLADNLTQVVTPDETWTATVNRNNQYQSAKGSAWRYDAVGNLIDDGKRTYTWDAAKRLIRVQDKTTTQKSEFAYDGQSRLTVRKEYRSATATPSETRYLWCGDKVCQSRDDQDKLIASYYAEGELQGTTPLYDAKDHLGSITDVVNAQGKPIGELDYGPYGETEKASGKLTDFRYAGMLHHAPTGFYLTHYRFYDPQTGRWLNRDPIGENGGINLYGYVGGNPMGFVDPMGLSAQIRVVPWWWPVGPSTTESRNHRGPESLTPEELQEFTQDYNKYKDLELNRPPKGSNCDDLKRQLAFWEGVEMARIAFTDKWYGGIYDWGHLFRIFIARNQIQKLKKRIADECNEPCP